MTGPRDHHPDGTPMTQEEIDTYWLTHVFKPNERQLTPRAVVTGMLLGGVLSLSNLYIGLKTGWGLAVTVTAAVLAYGIFSLLKAALPVGPFKAEFTSLENNTMASAASAAGYFTGAGLTSAIPALFLTTGRVLQWWELSLWILAISFLGVLLAVPMRRQMIDVDRLPFPEGLAYAETIRSLHAAPGEAGRKSRVLFLGAIGAAILKFASGFWTLIPEELALFGPAAAKVTLFLQTDVLMVGGGMLMGLRITSGLLIGAVAGWYFLGQWLFGHGLAGTGATYETVRTWILWPGVAMIVVNGLLAFGLKWRTAFEALRGMGRLASGSTGGMAAVEVPGTWFVRGMMAVTVFVVILGKVLFDIPVWMGVLATALSVVLSIVACRATGETSITPVGALGKITQLMYGGIAVGNIQTNLMTASITAGAAMHSADLLTDLKGGYILGSRPRHQFLAQFFGILAGAVFCIPAYRFLATPELLGSPKFPAPAAMTWKAVAELLSNGLQQSVRGVVMADATEVAALKLKAVPPGTHVGDELRVASGPNAGTYRIIALAGKSVVVDHSFADKTAQTPAVIASGGQEKNAGDGSCVMLPAATVGFSIPAVGAGASPSGQAKYAVEPRRGDYLRLIVENRELWWNVQTVIPPGTSALSHDGETLVLDRPLVDPIGGQALGGKQFVVRKESLPPYAAKAIVIAAILAVILTLLEIYLPAKWRAYVPSAAGIGLGTMVAGADSLSMFIGSLISWLYAKWNARSAESYALTIGSGLMAGGSIAGVLIILIQALK